MSPRVSFCLHVAFPGRCATSVSLAFHSVPLRTLSHLWATSVSYSPLALCLLLSSPSSPVLFSFHFCFMNPILSQRLLSPFLLPVLISLCLYTLVSWDFSCSCSMLTLSQRMSTHKCLLLSIFFFLHTLSYCV